MTRTAEENAADLAAEETMNDAVAQALLERPFLVSAVDLLDPEHPTDSPEAYASWLEATGLDDSFVGGWNGATFTPGTHDLFEAALEEFDTNPGAYIHAADGIPSP